MADIPAFQGPWAGDGSQMFALSQTLVAKAETYITQLGSIGIFPPTIDPVFPTIDTPPAPVTADLPPLQQVTWQVPPQPAAFNGTVNIDGLLPGPFTGVSPTLDFGAAPTALTIAVPDAPPIDLNFTFPTVAVTLPATPRLLSLDTVSFPTGSIPSFDVTVPALTAVAPNVFRFVEGGPYTSTLLSRLQTDLNNALSEGTFTGLSPEAEQGLYDRSREKEYRQMGDALMELDRMETMGFAFPPGVFIDARLKIQNEFGKTAAGLSRDIMVKQAELMLENIVKARENATQLEGQLIVLFNNVQQRSFETAKYATEAAIAIYNAQVQTYEASLKGFETQAMVYDTRIKGILAQIEIVKSQIEFEKVKSEINTALVQQYQAQVQAALAVIEIFKAQVQIIQVQADVEKIKVEVYGEQIKAFVGQINAYTAQVEGYKAQIESQGIIENVYKTQVEAFAAEVQAGVSEANAKVEVFKGQIAAYTAQLDGYKSAVQGMIGQAQAASLFNTAEADVYRAETNALSAYNNVLTAQWQAVLNEQEKIAEVAVSAAKANGDLFIAARGLSLDATKVGAQVSAQLGAAALGAIHWANNSSWSTNASSSFSIQTSTSNIDETITSV